MGKLVEKLQQIGQGSSGGIGFVGSRTPAQKPRPAAVFVSVGMNDRAVVDAALQSGVDGILLTGWTPGADVSAVKSAAEATHAVWGVEVAEGATADEGTSLVEVAQGAGAGFIVFSQRTRASEFFAEDEHLDVVATIDPPTDDMGLLLFRAQSFIPARAALLRAGFSAADAERLSIADYTRWRLIAESLRFPALVTVREVPGEAGLRTLVHLGVAALVLSGEGADAAQIGTRVAALREALEKTPTKPEERTPVSLGGLTAASGTSLTPPRREPERDPEHE